MYKQTKSTNEINWAFLVGDLAWRQTSNAKLIPKNVKHTNIAKNFLLEPSAYSLYNNYLESKKKRIT